MNDYLLERKKYGELIGLGMFDVKDPQYVKDFYRYAKHTYRFSEKVKVAHFIGSTKIRGIGLLINMILSGAEDHNLSQSAIAPVLYLAQEEGNEESLEYVKSLYRRYKLNKSKDNEVFLQLLKTTADKLKEKSR